MKGGCILTIFIKIIYMLVWSFWVWLKSYRIKAKIFFSILVVECDYNGK